MSGIGGTGIGSAVVQSTARMAAVPTPVGGIVHALHHLPGDPFLLGVVLLPHVLVLALGDDPEEAGVAPVVEVSSSHEDVEGSDVGFGNEHVGAGVVGGVVGGVGSGARWPMLFGVVIHFIY